MSGSSNGPSWQVTAATVLAGVGAGYTVGVLTAKWWQWRNRRGRSSQSQSDGCGEAYLRSHTALLTALSDLTSQVRDLHMAVSLAVQSARGRSRPESVVSDFASAQGDTPGGEEDYFDM